MTVKILQQLISLKTKVIWIKFIKFLLPKNLTLTQMFIMFVNFFPLNNFQANFNQRMPNRFDELFNDKIRELVKLDKVYYYYDYF